jgi:hypothetical protein
VHFKVYSNGEVQRSIGPKYLGKPRQAPRSARKRPMRSSSRARSPGAPIRSH